MRDIKEVPLNKLIKLYGHDKKNGYTWVSKGKVTDNYMFDGLELEVVFYTDYIVDGKKFTAIGGTLITNLDGWDYLDGEDK